MATEMIDYGEIDKFGTSKLFPHPLKREPIHVLVVDDNKVNQIIAAGFLEKLGCRVEIADGGFAALKWITQTHFDLILMDMIMPDMDGLETTRQIREWEQNHGQYAPIIAVTANDSSEERENCLKAGMDDFMSKPFRAKEMEQLINRFCLIKKSDSSKIHVID